MHARLRRLLPARSGRHLVAAAVVAATGLASAVASSPVDADADGDGDDATVSIAIVGGKPSPISAAPWQVALVFDSIDDPFQAQFCGGSLVTDRWVVTAAHCVDSLKPGEVQIAAGIGELDEISASDRLPVDTLVIHPQWDDDTLVNDIALVRLASPLGLNGTTRSTIALPTDQEPSTWPATGTPALISGWGSLIDANLFPGGLQMATVTVMAGPGDPFCGSYDGTFDRAVMLCAGTPGGGVDTCKGDSGGPLAIAVGAEYVLAGVTSWGNSCGLPGFPGVSTRVTAMVGWLTSVIGQTPTPVPPQPPPTPPSVPAAGGLVAVTPARLLDTRNGTGGPATAFGPGTTRTLQVAGRHGIPTTATTVAVNLTATQPTHQSHLIAWPTGTNRPTASSLNYAPGQTIANTVIVGLGPNGTLDLHNAFGTTHLIADITAWTN